MEINSIYGVARVSALGLLLECLTSLPECREMAKYKMLTHAKEALRTPFKRLSTWEGGSQQCRYAFHYPKYDRRLLTKWSCEFNCQEAVKMLTHFENSSHFAWIILCNSTQTLTLLKYSYSGVRHACLHNSCMLV